jgi:excinuclease ABC subunit C
MVRAEVVMQQIDRGIQTLKTALQHIPKQPGIYKMLSEKGEILYVGKAKNLFNRLSQYAQLNNLSQRIRRMVAQINQVEHMVTKNEMEALMLECNLIKTLRPPFNILMRDDKSYAYLQISKTHPFPRLVKFRGVRSEDAYYFGPYPFGMVADMTLTYLQKIFRIRNCTDQEFSNRTRPCLQYFIKRCSAPCVGLIDAKEYATSVHHAKKFLEGKTIDVQEYLTDKMNTHSAALEFEKAATYRDRLQLLTHLKTKQSLNVEEADLIYIHSDHDKLFVEIVLIRYGRDLGHQSIQLDHSEYSDLAEGMASFLLQFYEKYPVPQKIIVNQEPTDVDLVKQYLQAHQDDGSRSTNLQIVDNSHQLMKLVQKQMGRTETKVEYVLQTLSQQLACTVNRIECYDNSHMQGVHAYGVMVVATHAGFMKALYRKFQIRDIKTGDDYAMMRQVLRRRLQHQDWPYPDVILVDGGKGQVSAVQEILNELNLKITIVGIAKGEKRNDGHERFYVNDDTEMVLDDQSPLRYFLQRLRDEAHRFAITTHKKKRDVADVSRLDDIPGIGPGRKKNLIGHFGSVKSLASASIDDLQLVKGISPILAKTIWQFFNDK